MTEKKTGRRDMLLAGLGAAAGAIAAAAVTRDVRAQTPATKYSDQPLPPPGQQRRQALELGSLEPKGTYYEVEAPDTLDLAEHGRLAINALTGHLAPDNHYAVYQSFTFDKEPKLNGLTWNLPAKDARVLPMLRVMTGSAQHLDLECGLMRALLGQIREDGLAYSPISNEGAPSGTAYPFPNGMLALAMLNWHQRDGNPQWLDLFKRLTTALARIAVRKEDRAYWPPESSYRPDGSWAWTTRGAAKIPYQPPEEPYLEQQGTEGCVKFEQAAPLRALIQRYRMDKDPLAWEVARRVVRFMLKPGMWEDLGDEGYAGNEHGIFAGHFHGNVTALHALLDMALATDDGWLKQFVRESYDYARRTGIARIGWFPGWLRPTAHQRDANLFLSSETCGVADMLVLAVKLSDAGLGDFWDDVDAIARNHLVAQQITDWEQMRALGGGDPQKDALLRRLHGGFNQQERAIDDSAPHTFGCCTANGSVGLYYAWHGITRFDEPSGMASVNLLLNRAAAWLDIDSSLPYEGRVIIHNKLAQSVLLRLPSWVAGDQVKCFVDDKSVRPALTGNHLLFSDLRTRSGERDGSAIRLEFPVSTTTERHTVGGRQYNLTFRGATLVDLTPRNAAPGCYRYYLRGEMTRERAPVRRTRRFVAEKLIAVP